MTTRLYSVDRWIKEFFQSAQCKVNAICFIASGRGDDLLELYDVNLYFEGNNDETTISATSFRMPFEY